jgi:RNA polymerase sigma-70 factor (sigma-E family)
LVAFADGFCGKEQLHDNRTPPVSDPLAVSTPAPDFDTAFRGLFVRAFRVANSVLRDRVEAEDAAAETMARTLVAWRRIADSDYLEAWVARVAANVAVDMVRKRGRSLEPSAVVVGAGPESDAQSLDRLVLVEALGKLPRRQRDVLVLRYFSDLSEAEIAAVLGVSRGAVKRYAHRGIGRLRQDVLGLDPDDVISPRMVQVALR